jgi:DNA-binding CsgD family transcriptional regulator
MGAVWLGDLDIAALDGFLEVIAQPCPVGEFQRRTVEAIPAVVPSTTTAWNEVDSHTYEMANPVIVPTPPDWQLASMTEIRQLFAAHAHEHPVLQHQLRTGDGRPHTISDFCTQEQFRQTALYRDLYAKMGVEDQMAIRLPSPHLVVAITLTSEGWNAFTGRDRLLINLMRSHIIQGRRNAYAFEKLQRLLTSVEQRVEGAGEGLLLVDHRDRIDYASPNAKTILANWLGDWRHIDLPDTLEHWVRHEAAAGLPKAPQWPLILQRPHQQLTIRRVPTPDADGVALLVTERDLDLAVSVVLARLGLTPRQGEVLELAMQGTTNAHIAALLRITTDTVETHMTNALARLGAENRTAAANLIYQAINDRDRTEMTGE